MPLTNKKNKHCEFSPSLKAAILNVDWSMASFLNVPYRRGVFTSVAGCFAVSVSGLNEPSACCESHRARGTSCIKTITLPQLLGLTGQADALLQEDRIASVCKSKSNIQIKNFYYMYHFPLIYTFNAHLSETNATEKNSSTIMISQSMAKGRRTI